MYQLTQIVAQPGHLDAEHVHISDTQLRLSPLKALNILTSKVTDPEGEGWDIPVNPVKQDFVTGLASPTQDCAQIDYGKLQGTHSNLLLDYDTISMTPQEGSEVVLNIHFLPT